MKMYTMLPIFVCWLTLGVESQVTRQVGRFQEVFAWKQVTFDINGTLLTEDRDTFVSNTRDSARTRRQSSNVFFDNDRNEPERNWNQQYQSSTPTNNPWQTPRNNRPGQSGRTTYRPVRWPTSARPPTPTSSTQRPSDEAGRFFIQYNNLPMGVERVDNRLFITLPRRRHGIPSTLNYVDLSQASISRSPPLRPHPGASGLTSVYRTRADSCARLWMVDTGLLEIPNARQQVQPPGIVVFDLQTDRQIFRYQLRDADLVSAVTPTGLASITIDITNGDCSNAHAYIPDLATYGLIVYSLRDNNSWRLSHNFFSFEPTAGNFNIAGQRFQWNDGIFSITLSAPGRDGCRSAYFHSMVGTREYSVSACLLNNSTAASEPEYWARYSVVGDRGVDSQSTMHGYHEGTGVIFFANIARDGVSCWNTGNLLSPASTEILARDTARMSYVSDLHVTGDEVWIMANSLPTWAYSRLDTNEYNFYVYKANVQDLIANTVCSGRVVNSLTSRSGAEETPVDHTNSS